MADDQSPDDQAPTESPRAPIETREAVLDKVNCDQRIITVIAAPYGQAATVEYRGELWQEIFERTAWQSLRTVHPGKVRANRMHDRGKTVGKAIKFWPDRDEGLVADIKIANTPLGEETLELAKDDCLSMSVGFGVLPKNQRLERRTMTRHIVQAYLDHLAFVESPAYENADILSVRDDGLLMPLAPRVATPDLDQFIRDDIMRWADERLK